MVGKGCEQLAQKRRGGHPQGVAGVYIYTCIYIYIHTYIYRQTDRQKDRQTDRQTDVRGRAAARRVLLNLSIYYFTYILFLIYNNLCGM